jgi:hypothetical protein
VINPPPAAPPDGVREIHRRLRRKIHGGGVLKTLQNTTRSVRTPRARATSRIRSFILFAGDLFAYHARAIGMRNGEATEWQ